MWLGILLRCAYGCYAVPVGIVGDCLFGIVEEAGMRNGAGDEEGRWWSLGGEEIFESQEGPYHDPFSDNFSTWPRGHPVAHMPEDGGCLGCLGGCGRNMNRRDGAQRRFDEVLRGVRGKWE
jgi:hypothetical protein